MNNKNFLSNIRSPFLDSPSSDVSHGRRSAVVRPSFGRRSTLLRLMSILAILLTVGVEQMWATTVTKTINQIVDANGYSVSSGNTINDIVTSFALDANITISTSGSANCGSFWGSSTKDWRLYQNRTGNVTITAASGYELESVTYTYSVSNSGILNTSGNGSSIASSYQKASGTAISISGSSYTLHVGNTGTGTNGQVRITQISVTYSATASCDTKPTVGSSLTSVSATVNSITVTVPISAIGGCNITENGLVYSTSVATPEVGAANCTKVTVTACGSTAANKTVTITDLTCGQSYYVRGYATNDAGTSYTNVTTQSTSACPLYTVTLKDDNSTYTQASYGASVTLPSRAGCSGYTFAGWSTTNNTSWTTTVPTIINAGSYTPTGNIDLYPVYTKTESGSEEDHDGPSWIRSGGSNTSTSGYTFATASSMGSSTDYYQDGSATTGQVKLYHTSTAIFSSTPTSVKLTAKIGGGTGGTSLNTPVYAQLLNSSGTAIGNATEITSYITTNTGDTYTDVELDLTGITSAYGVMVYHAKQTSYNVRYYSFSLTYTTGGSTTSYISVPNCCTQLAQINGSSTLNILF